MGFSARSPVLKYRNVIQQRYVVAVMMLFGCIIMFSLRVSLCVAIVQMTSAEEDMSKWAVNSTCPNDLANTTGTVLNKKFKVIERVPELSWSDEVQGVILSSFFYGYVPSHVTAPIITGWLGGKYSLGLSILTSSLCTLLSPLTARLGGWKCLAFLRVIAGFGEGLSFPAMSVILAHWIPPTERSTAVTFVFTGAQMGTVVGTALSGILLHYFAWPVTFYFYGICGVLWCLMWQLICYSKPSLHPFISDSEHKYISESIKPDKKVKRVPIRAILTSPAVWALMLGQVGHDWSFFTMITDLPSYMSRVLHFSIRDDGLLSALPYLIMWICSNLFAVLSDWVIAKKWMPIVTVRKINTMIAAVMPALGVVAASYAGCDREWVVTLLCIGMAGMGAFYPGLRANALDITKNYAATVMALENGFGAISGIASPSIVGMITTDNTVDEWREVFWIMFGVLIGTNIIYCIFARGTYQAWDGQQEEDAELKPQNSLDILAISGEDFTCRL